VCQFIEVEKRIDVLYWIFESEFYASKKEIEEREKISIVNRDAFAFDLQLPLGICIYDVSTVLLIFLIYIIPRVRAGYTRGGRRVAGTGTTGRRVRRARVDVFFSKPYPTRLIPVPVVGTRVPWVRVRGYSGTRVGGSGTGRVGGSNVITVY
jgi:hypothetical protein